MAELSDALFFKKKERKSEGVDKRLLRERKDALAYKKPSVEPLVEEVARTEGALFRKVERENRTKGGRGG